MKTILILVCLLFSTFGFGQSDSTKSVPFVAYWSKGDSYDFLITKVNKQYKGETIEKKDSNSYYATFEVIDSTATSYKINWKYKSNFTNLPFEYGELLNNNSVLISFVYTTNELGEFIGVENWEEVAELMKIFFNSIINDEISKGTKTDEVKLRNAMEPILNIFSSKEGIELIVLKELQYFLFPLGVEFDPKEAVVYDEEFPNLINGNPLRGEAKISFQTIDHENSFCTFNQEIIVNPDDAKNLIVDFVTQMKLNNIDFAQQIKNSNLSIVDNNYYEYFYYPGVPYFIETNRTTEFTLGDNKNKRVELIRIELILDDD